MFVTKVAGEQKNSPCLELPTWEHIESAIRSMDGEVVSALWLLPDKLLNHYMLINGGSKWGWYVVEAPLITERWDLVNAARELETDDVDIVVGYQLIDVPAWRAMRIEDVLKAARFYAERGELHPELKWRLR